MTGSIKLHGTTSMEKFLKLNIGKYGFYYHFKKKQRFEFSSPI